ncbi:hypothetical protein MBLNU457_1664t1 [Dothideomycetes sp. NU457]
MPVLPVSNLQGPLRSVRRYRSTSALVLALAIFLVVLEPIHHVRNAYSFARPTERLDPPAHQACVNPEVEAARTVRQSAAIFMLARNSEVDDAIHAVRSLETQFNQWFGYPWVFLNDVEWTEDFKTRVSAEIKGKAVFETIDKSMWGWPGHFTDDDKQRARNTWKNMFDSMDENFQKGTHVQKESYHHMCRFNSGFFYDHPALAAYKYYWRVEPGVSYTCKIPYDPFAYMARENKKYGYTIALYEVGSLIPSFFRATADFVRERYKQQRPLWLAMFDASWAPWPIRRFILSRLSSRSFDGDPWNFCHFWSNFEIADLDFFRSQEYRDYFEYLDSKGGFYFERWGDAPVHSLAAAFMLEPEQVHYFQDIGYRHPPFQHCPIDQGVGCDCECDNSGLVAQFCLQRLRETVEPL